ncbi:MAG: hypothetical protein HY287_02770 [Planctomycetes bacterium]|nr:hypothetical protein [Planctomycetota bacterium]MBI3833234.1 hypothetical protein [Planctomycetota bacterium]
MNRWMTICASIVAFATVSLRAQEQAPTNDELLKELRRLNERMGALEATHESDQKKIRELEDRLKTLESTPTDPLGKPQSTAPVKSSGEGPSTAEPPNSEDELQALLGEGATKSAPSPSPQTKALFSFGPSPSGGGIQSFNPDISLNGDMLATYSKSEGGQNDDEFLFRELEIGFSGNVDPYTRADMIVTVGKQSSHDDYEADLEEAYLTFLQLPAGLQARAGLFRSEFGRANPTHLHALPWIDYPFVIKRYFGTDGLSGTGAELSWLVPNKWNEYLGLTYEIFNNDNDTLFAGRESDDFTNLLRFKASHDLSPASTLELGSSIATAPNDSGHGSHRATVGGVDVTYHWKPKGSGLYRSFLWQTEVLASHSETPHGGESAWGMYSAAEYQFARQWKMGVRYDNTELPNRASLNERGYSAYLTFLQSEFVFWRLGYIYTDRNFREDGNWNDQQVMLQLNWTLGAHPAHRF